MTESSSACAKTMAAAGRRCRERRGRYSTYTPRCVAAPELHLLPASTVCSTRWAPVAEPQSPLT